MMGNYTCLDCGHIGFTEKNMRMFCPNCQKKKAEQSAMETKREKPPLGLIPRYIREDQRIDEILKAFNRYMERHYIIPVEWIEEYNELVKKLDNRS